MKKLSIFVIFSCVSILNLSGQSAFTTLFCESDTSFSGKLHLSSNGLNYRAFAQSARAAVNLTGQVIPGKINGTCLNKSGSSFTTTGNVSSILNIIQYSACQVIDGNKNLGKLFKLTSVSSRDPNPRQISIGNIIELDQTIFGNNKLNALLDIKLGVTTFSSSQQKGNYFANEQLISNNKIQFMNTGDSSAVSILQKISSATYPSDNANYQNILGTLKAYENSGWLIEVDRLGDKFNGKRYDLGRGPRIDYFINSTRSSSAANALASVTSSYQIFGDTASVIVKSLLTNGVQKLYVYDENNSLEDYFVLLNDVVGGEVQPLQKSKLINIYETALKAGATLFPKLSSLVYSPELSKLLLSVQGGKFLSSRFSDTSMVASSYLSKLFSSFDDGYEINVKYGGILNLDLVSNKLELGLMLGNTGIKGKVISNPLQLSIHNFDYQDSMGNSKTFEYLFLTEGVNTNVDKQNPERFLEKKDFQNEVYSINLTGKTTIDKNQFSLFGTLPKNTILKIAQYNECYTPLIGNLTNLTDEFSSSDSLVWIDGLANNFIKGGMCEKISVNGYEKNSKRLIAFPNPVSKSSNNILQMQGIINGPTYVHTLQGVKVLDFSGPTVDISSLQTGVYYLVNGNRSIKIVILD